jgi:hypothetical protein
MLSAGLAHMGPAQRQSLWQAAMTIGEAQHKGWVLEGLCAETKHLPAEQGTLFDQAMALSDPAHLAPALAGLARAIDVLGDAHTAVRIWHT